MCGKSVFTRNLLLFAFVFVFSISVHAQQSKSATNAVASQKGFTTESEVDVYDKPDFDAKIIGQLKPGQLYDISAKTIGPFYKIRLKPGLLGYVSDAEITVKKGGARTDPSPVGKTKKTSSSRKQQESERKPSKPFVVKRYRGLVLEQINFTEDTMGAVRSSTLPFYGLKFSGFNTMFSGDVYADGEIMVHSGAPAYYQKVTGQAASGLIIQANFLFETPSMQGRNYLLYYGFGPVFRYSQFNTSVLDTTTGLVSNFVLDNMNLGAVFNVGLAFQLGPCALRSDVRYYIESRQYMGYGLALQFEF